MGPVLSHLLHRVPHGGEIDVSTQAGQGTAFRFWVPLVEKQPAPEEELRNEV